VADKINYPYKDHSAEAVTHKVAGSQAPELLWQSIQKNTPGITWFLTAQEFRTLMLYDLHSILTHGHTKSLKPDHMRNPITGNRFHRVGERGDLSVGVRWFIFDLETPDQIGMRVRFQPVTKEDHSERESTREHIVEAEKEVEKMPFLSLPEPPQERQRGNGRVPEQGQ
jgi:hypothetical protein